MIISLEQIAETIEITIQGNGQGLSDDRLKELSIEAHDLGLTFARDLIVYAHHGSVDVNSKLREYLQITITIPKITD